MCFYIQWSYSIQYVSNKPCSYALSSWEHDIVIMSDSGVMLLVVG
ncbi:hypothetical protein [Xenorhabdus szentirmaii]|nr:MULTISPECIES: hypothetical protein [Xenorhabdus]